MGLSADALLFGIVLILFGVQTAFPVTPDGETFVIAGLGVSLLALSGSAVLTIRRLRTDGAEEDT